MTSFSLLLSISIFSGCTSSNPEDVALAACEAMPGIAVDAVTLALSRDLFVAAEVAHWESQAWTLGLDTIGPAGYGVIRANSSCTVTSIAIGETGGWNVELIRHEPDVGAASFELREVENLATLERRLNIRIVETDEGLRAEASVLTAHTAWKTAHESLEAGDFLGAETALQEIHRSFPDPMLIWDMAEARDRRQTLGSFSYEVDFGTRTKSVGRAKEAGHGGLTITHEGPRPAELEVEVSIGSWVGSWTATNLPPGVELSFPFTAATPVPKKGDPPPSVRVVGVKMHNIVED